ncbi:MAG: hypothetical protein EOO10_05810 [Chitinophagaceae bacterium]|nr:MAG: hypothetical protein EOO10_05810 [Chitinophagaceae bacterium]
MDSLKSVLVQLKDQKNSLYWSNQRAKFVRKADTNFVRPDSAIACYYLSDGKLLMQESIEFDSQKSRTAYIERYYDNKRQVVYAEHWFVMNAALFDGKLEKKERWEYDKLGRTILHVTYYSGMTGWTERRYYSYDVDGNSTVTLKKFKSWVFWD